MAIVYGCWSKEEWFDPTFKKRLKARQREKSEPEDQSDDSPAQQGDLAAPVFRKEAKQGRKATAPQKSGSSSERSQGAFPRPIPRIRGHLFKLDFLLGISTRAVSHVLLPEPNVLLLKRYGSPRELSKGPEASPFTFAYDTPHPGRIPNHQTLLSTNR
ncbi:hypothetical protein [Salinibacter ruber]|uniref:hypothetical protein n=1 Tax=Salinibacter ruber TaxID=146919 RepID=UPI002167A175|nr:hypothetical protein [Salinibacter ruber]MCS3785683.1 hypothetical protein [Salinibacter ruber]